MTFYYCLCRNIDDQYFSHQQKIFVGRQDNAVREGQLVHDDLARVVDDVVLQHATARGRQNFIHTVAEYKVCAEMMKSNEQ